MRRGFLALALAALCLLTGAAAEPDNGWTVDEACLAAYRPFFMEDPQAPLRAFFGEDWARLSPLESEVDEEISSTETKYTDPSGAYQARIFCSKWIREGGWMDQQFAMVRPYDDESPGRYTRREALALALTKLRDWFGIDTDLLVPAAQSGPITDQRAPVHQLALRYGVAGREAVAVDPGPWQDDTILITVTDQGIVRLKASLYHLAQLRSVEPDELMPPEQIARNNMLLEEGARVEAGALYPILRCVNDGSEEDAWLRSALIRYLVVRAPDGAVAHGYFDALTGEPLIYWDETIPV